MTAIHFTIKGEPIGKPRQTRSDVWKKRPCVVRYRSWADSARAQAPKDLPKEPTSVSIVAYFSLPQSWSQKKRAAMVGKLHQQKPDADNVLKCIDGLWKQDKGIAICRIEKRYDDGKGPRMEVVVL